MKVIKISDETYDKLKACVIDPFDDTAETVISRLVGIVEKARKVWSAWDDEEQAEEDDEKPGPSNSRSSKDTKGSSAWRKNVEPLP